MSAAPQQFGYDSGASLDAAERERLMIEHLPQVRAVARRIHERLPAHVLLEDLVQAGVVGLIDALHKYNPERNAQLATYARFRIRGAILDSLRALDWSPRELRRQGRELQEAIHGLREKLGRTPTEEEVCASLSITAADYHHLIAELDRMSVETAPADEDAPPAVETAASPDPDPFELCRRGEARAILAGLLEELPERDRQILSLYYFEELTMKEVGAVLGLGESRISQIHSGLLAKLRVRVRNALRPASEPPGARPRRAAGASALLA